jgi:predicted metal-dependent phosphoesterase TrpH
MSAPADLVERAASLGLAAVSITDHDTIEGQREALLAGEKHGIEVLEGIEFSVRIDDLDTHILGYLIDPESSRLIESVSLLAEARVERAREIVRRLGEKGLEVSFEKIRERAGRGTIGRPHIAQLLVERGLVSGFQAAFGRYIGEGRPCYVPKEVLSLESVIELIQGAGGIAVWAHPGERARDEGLLDGLIEAGVGGIEAFHPNHDPETARAIFEAASRRGLVATGGSDFHFYEAKQIDIGEITVSYSAVSALRKAVI